MNCECMEKLVENINEKYPEKYPELKAQEMLNFITGNFQYYLNLTYRKKKKDNRLTDKRFDLPIILSHCPFCGKKYEITKEQSNV